MLRSIKRATISYLINQVLTKHTPLKQKLPYDKTKRRTVGQHPAAMTHAFRKFFTSTAVNEGGMLPDWADLLTGHKMPGVRNSYLIPTPKQLLEGTAERKEGYLYVEPWLTINNIERERLARKRLEATIESQQDVKKEVMKLENAVAYMAQFMQKYHGMKPEYQKLYLKKDLEKMGVNLPREAMEMYPSTDFDEDPIYLRVDDDDDISKDTRKKLKNKK